MQTKKRDALNSHTIGIKYKVAQPESVPMKGKPYRAFLRKRTDGELIRMDRKLYAAVKPIWAELKRRGVG